MTLSLEQLSSRMRRGEDIPLRETAQVVLALSIPSILQQMVVTAMEYIDAAMVGHIGAEATAAIGIVSSSTWLLHGILVGLYTAFSIQIAQYLGADRQADARGVLRQAMLFNLILGLAAAGFGIGISRFLPGWLGADLPLQANASAYFAIWSAALPFTMAMGMYAAMLRATGDALTPGLIRRSPPGPARGRGRRRLDRRWRRRHPSGTGRRTRRRAGHLDGPGDPRGGQAPLRGLRPGRRPRGRQGLQLPVCDARPLLGRALTRVVSAPRSGGRSGPAASGPGSRRWERRSSRPRRP